MFVRRKSIDENQGILSSFMKGDKLVGDIISTGKNTGATRQSTNTSAKKRVRPLSPQDNSLTESNKRAHLDQSMENNTPSNDQQSNHNQQTTVDLNPQLTELKRQIFAGLDSMLAPLKKEIKELKDDQKEILDGDKCINENKIAKKFIQNEEKKGN